MSIELTITQARDSILSRMVESFRHRPGMLAMFLRGSLAEGTADAWSDIDFSVVVDDEHFDTFCTERHAAPEKWGELLFNSGSMGPNMCVSHFAPCVKVDVFYYRPADLAPSAWFTRAIRVFHDERGIVSKIIERSRGLDFHPDPSAINHSINQAIGSAHEVIRRIERGELGYAREILTDVRRRVAFLDDFLNNRPPAGLAHFETRCADPATRHAIAASHPRSHEPAAILAALKSLMPILARQIAALGAALTPARDVERDHKSLSLVVEWKLER